MSFDLIELFNRSKTLGELVERLSSRTSNLIFTSPLSGSAKALLINKIAESQREIVLLMPDIQSINEIKVELSILGLDKLAVAVDEFKLDILQEKLTGLSSGDGFILISTYDILKVKMPARQYIEKNTTTLTAGGDITYEELIEYFETLNYSRVKFVEGVGDYSIRGSIIDFWSYSENNPCRVEFDGDFLESLRYFDSESQRSSNVIDTVTIASNMGTAETELVSDIFDYLGSPLIIASRYELYNTFEKATSHSATDNTVQMIEDAELATELQAGLPSDELYGQSTEGREPEYDNQSTLEGIFKKNARWIIEDPFSVEDNTLKLQINEAPPVNSNYELLFNTLQDYSARGYKIIITSENEFQSKRLKDLLTEYKEELAGLIDDGKVKIYTLAIHRGFILKQDKLLVLTDYQIFNKPYRTKFSAKQRVRKSRAKEFASLKRGDFVVHENYGIGRFEGLEVIKIGEVSQESIKILYDEGGKVYVNLNYFNLVKKFSSKDNSEPKLSKLGGDAWESAKRKVKKKIKDAARGLIELYAKRKASRGFAFSPDTIWQKELEASFLYEDTPDQSKVTEDVKTDMQSESPMDRLVCGDVGFGKTEIAVRAAFKAASEGKQATILVPTTILAEQHMNTFRDRLSQFPIRIEGLSRFQTKKKQNEIVRDLAEGKVDILIGTHRLLSKDIVFRDLGLLIIDEEHRFGVVAKEKLRSIKLNVDTLTLTATPIPRTLNFSLLGARDLSIMGTPPPNRQPIYTHVRTFDILKIREWIMTELKRHGQVYFIHDRIQSIYKIADYLHKYMPDLRIGIAHGQIKPLVLENVIYDFLNKKYDVLLATKIIESGIDIPNVNTIIVNRADRFGLAELHQLRGRVGRSDRQAYAYFLVPSLKSINKNAIRRLQAIEEFTDVGAGFSLSMRDLEIRGAGNLLGTEQTGFIDTVGFDMYVKLLDEAVEELRHQEFKDVFKELPSHRMRTDPTVDTYFEVGIPKAYMPDPADRLSFYTVLFSMKALIEAEEIKEELEDRFGKLPVLVKRLIMMAALKYYASYALFERIIIQHKTITIILPKEEKEEYYKTRFNDLTRYIMENYSNEIKFASQKDVLKLVMPNKYDTPENCFEFLTRFCHDVEKVVNPGDVVYSAVELFK
ncbi:MAG: transcription-repair coupling factor [Ignavibacteria bacterium]